MKDLFEVSGKVALVTGGSRGIGEMIAEGYVTHGVKTYISARKAEACDATAARLSEIGECISIPADLSTAEGIAELVEEIKGRENKLDILVNNAGAAWGEPIETFPEAAWDKVMTINVKSPFFLTRELLPLLEKAAAADDPARVIMIGSVDGINVNSRQTFAYGPSKAAVHHLARTLAAHLAPRNRRPALWNTWAMRSLRARRSSVTAGQKTWPASRSTWRQNRRVSLPEWSYRSMAVSPARKVRCKPARLCPQTHFVTLVTLLRSRIRVTYCSHLFDARVPDRH
jgi:NAD(P)-dependent dehydrogenase (short-subunit alcohol dehydrogenase family)